MSEPKNCISQIKLITIVFVILFLGLMHFPGALDRIYLDSSWLVFFDYAWTADLQCGRDYVFTFGPLFTLFAPLSNPDLFWLKLIGANIFIAFLCFLLAVGAVKSLKWRSLVLFCLALIICRESWPMFSVFFLCACLPKRNMPTWFKIAALVLLAWLPLIKLSYGIIMLPSLTLVGLAIFARDRKDGLKKLLSGMAILIISFMLCWLLCGQNLLFLPDYLLGSYEIIRGFSLEMGLSTSSTDPLLDLIIALSGIVFIFMPLLCCISADFQGMPKVWYRRLRADYRVFVFLLGLAYAFFCFKAAFTRQDSSHMLQWYFMIPVAVVLLSMVPGSLKSRIEKGMFYWCIVFYIAFVSIYTVTDSRRYIIPKRIITMPVVMLRNISNMATAADLLRRHKRQIISLNSKAALPQLQKIVGNASIGMLGSPLIEIPIRNGLNYKTTPVIQGYSAYTPYLQKLNRDFIDGNNAPEYIMYYLPAKEMLVPGADIIEMFKRYRLVKRFDSFDLYKLRHEENVLKQKCLMKKNIKWGETLDLSGYKNNPVIAKIIIEPSLFGKISTFLLRPPEVEFATQVGSSYQRFPVQLCRDGCIIKGSKLTFRPGTFLSVSIDQLRRKLAPACFSGTIRVEIYDLSSDK